MKLKLDNCEYEFICNTCYEQYKDEQCTSEKCKHGFEDIKIDNSNFENGIVIYCWSCGDELVTYEEFLKEKENASKERSNSGIKV